mmetsp:Transcript_47384/g.141417  ORF Transcript_47384/g.141417 Transcript_47384/m.141417 type:complete len:245 (+) Transcript_47384:76-810(+)
MAGARQLKGPSAAAASPLEGRRAAGSPCPEGIATSCPDATLHLHRRYGPAGSRESCGGPLLQPRSAPGPRASPPSLRVRPREERRRHPAQRMHRRSARRPGVLRPRQRQACRFAAQVAHGSALGGSLCAPAGSHWSHLHPPMRATRRGSSEARCTGTKNPGAGQRRGREAARGGRGSARPWAGATPAAPRGGRASGTGQSRGRGPPPGGCRARPFELPDLLVCLAAVHLPRDRQPLAPERSWLS